MQISISQAAECRHLWMDGFCVKCGISQEDMLMNEDDKATGIGGDELA